MSKKYSLQSILYFQINVLVKPGTCAILTNFKNSWRPFKVITCALNVCVKVAKFLSRAIFFQKRYKKIIFHGKIKNDFHQYIICRVACVNKKLPFFVISRNGTALLKLI